MTVAAISPPPELEQRRIACWLRTVLPSEGRYCLAHRRGKKGVFRHQWFDSVYELAGTALQLTASGHDCWVAVAAFDNEGSREKEHVRALRSLFLDIDVKAGDDGHYQTIDEAREALTKFEAAFVPASTIVCSGYGLHVYWSFESDLSAVQWTSLAEKFKAFTRSRSLHVDAGCTADATRVLRIPGTSNFKNSIDPRPVLIEHSGEPIALAILETKLANVSLGVLAQSLSNGTNLSLQHGTGHYWFDTLSIENKRHELQKMLAALGATVQDDRDSWLRVGAALRGVNGLDYEERYAFWRDWSCQQPRWTDHWNDDVERKRFDGLTKSGFGALIKLAIDQGYQRRWIEPTERFRTPEEAGEWLRDEFIFVESEGGYRRLDGTRVTVQTFARICARHMPMGNNGRALSADRLAMEVGYVERVAATGYGPGEGRIYIENGVRFANTYRPWNPEPLEPTPEELSLLAALETHLANGDNDTKLGLERIRKGFAYLVQNPKARLPIAMLLVGSTQGSGKTTLMLVIPRLLLGCSNISAIGNNEAGSDFNAWSGQHRIVMLDEIFMPGSRDALTRSNNLKATISDERIRIHAKGKDGYEVRNVTTICATSNYIDAVHLTESDRRWLVVETTAGFMPVESSRPLYKFLNSERAAGVLTWIYQKMDISDFNPHEAPPMSQAKRRTIETSRNELEMMIVDKWENKEGCFAYDIVKAEYVRGCLELRSELGRIVSLSAIQKILLREPIKAVKVITSKWDGEKPRSDRGYIIRNPEQWHAAGASAQYDELQRGRFLTSSGGGDLRNLHESTTGASAADPDFSHSLQHLQHLHLFRE